MTSENDNEAAAEGAHQTKAPNLVDRHVGARVKMRRMMLGMSQSRLGELIGVTFQQIQKYEKGANRISVSRLSQLAQHLGVEAGYFYEGAPVEPRAETGLSDSASGSYIVDFLSTAEGLQLNRAFAQVRDPKVRRKIIDLVNSLIDQQA